MQHSQNTNQAWAQELNQDSLAGEHGDDVFSKFLELGGDFSQFETGDTQNVPSGLDTPMGRLNFTQDGHMQPLSPQQQAMLQSMQMNMAEMNSTMDFMHTSPHQHQHQHTPSQQYQQYTSFPHMQNPYQHQVPPTPVSTEMRGTKYTPALDSAGQIIFDRQNNASFTPLVSPAQTPIDNPWGMPDYVVADDFFSPLTSPAIEAQQHYASTNATSSPVDMGIDQPTSAGRKPRKKLNPSSRVGSTRNLRGSPATKPTTRRRQPSNGGGAGSHLQQNGSERQRHLLPTGISSTAVSSEDSVSPEPLSESLMRPPPVPTGRTPGSLRQSDDGTMPATPATLMRIPGKQANVITTGETTDSPEVMEDIALPAAAADLLPRTLPELTTTFSDHAQDDSSTPTMSAKTPKLSADSTPHSAGPRPNGSNDLARPSRGGRTSKKRQSISQATVSPALRPKISPSISPLVPSTAAGMPVLSAETSALYLASKSNYQNIIDGTHLPGVSYPETLAENLSSKRTSHKIAEQGRRNRINLALKEIEALLPPAMATMTRKDSAKSKEDSSGEKSAAAQGASKASTVELAIVYIRSLQAELKDTRDKLEVAEKSLAEGIASGSQTSGESNAS